MTTSRAGEPSVPSPRPDLDLRRFVDQGAPAATESPRRPSVCDPGLLGEILNGLTDGVIVANRDGRFVFFNPTAERILGIGPLDVDPSEWTTSYGCFREDRVTPYPAEDLPLARAIRGETVYDCPVFIRNPRNPDGVWLSINAAPLRAESDGILGGVIVFRDETERRHDLERVQLLSAAVEQTADTVIVTDREGVIKYVNPAVRKTTGFTEHELVGRTPRALRSGLHDAAFYATLWKTLMEGRVYRGTIVNRKKNGDLYHSEQTITPIRDPDGAFGHFVSVGKDMTEIMKAAEAEGKLRLARAVQQRLYPDAPPEAGGLDIAGVAFTADETGGDYFDYLPMTDASLGIAVGDVSGHGIDAALVMAATRAYLRSMAQLGGDPGDILALVNRVLVQDLGGSQFVTLALACLNAPAGILRYASAGHTTGYLLDASGEVKQELASTGVPLGMFDGARFESVTAPAVAEGDLVALFTDGLTESLALDETPFGTARTLEVLRAHRGEPAAKIVHRLYRAARDFARDRQNDDITVVVCKVCDRAHGRPPRREWWPGWLRRPPIAPRDPNA